MVRVDGVNKIKGRGEEEQSEYDRSDGKPSRRKIGRVKGGSFRVGWWGLGWVVRLAKMEVIQTPSR